MTAAQRASAERMLASKGQTISLKHIEPGAYDPATGTNSTVTTIQTVSAVILPFSQGIRKQADTSVLATDRWCILAGLKTDGSVLTAPAVNDEVTDTTGDKWTVIEVSPLTPAGLDIIYEITLRGAG